MPDNLPEIDYNICLMAVNKCHLLFRAVKVGLPCYLTKDNFGFPDLTEEELECLNKKLVDASELEWLRNQPKEVE